MESTKTDQPAPICAICGEAQGDGCYSLCPNSVSYYSREREIADEAFYGADDKDGWGDPELADYYDDDLEYEADVAPMRAELAALGLDPNDLPF